jgi:small subunit ribosomal protein S9
MPTGETYYGTGHRKTAVARVWIIAGGTGQVTVNKRPLAEYCPVSTLHGELVEPFEETKTVGRFDVWATTQGGGFHSQIGAIRHGIAKALVEFDGGFRGILRPTGHLTRDPRVKERKKFGRKRARRGFQFSKR